MKRNKIFALLTISILVISIGMTASMSPAKAETKQEEEPVKIAILQPRQQQGLYFYGTWAIQGFKLGLQYATNSDSWESPYQMENGQEIQTKVYNTEGTPDVGVSKAREAITDWGADIIFGTSHSPVATSVQSIAQEYETPYFICPGASAALTQDPNFNKYIFRVGRNNWHDAKTSAYYYGKQQEIDSVAYLGIDNTFGYNGVETAKKAFSEYDVESVATEFAPAGTTNFKPYLERIKNQDPDRLYIVWAGDGFGPLYQSISNLDMMDKVIGSVIDLFTMNRVNLVSGGLYEGTSGFSYFAYDVNSGPQYEFMLEKMKENDIRPNEFAGAYSQQEGDVFDKLSKMNAPELWHGQAFASAQFIVKGIKSGSVSEPDNLIEAWEGMELETPLGDTLIRPRDHQGVRPMYIAEAVKDTEDNDVGREGFGTEGLIVGERIEKIPRKFVDPPVKTDYEPMVSAFNVQVTPSTTEGEVPLEVDFDVSTSGGVSPYEYQWEFGDETTSQEQNPTHTFEESGEKTVSLSVTDDAGDTVTKEVTVNVQSGGLPTWALALLAIVIIVIILVGIIKTRG